MGYLIRLDRLPRFLTDIQSDQDSFIGNFPRYVRPKGAFPHLCFIITPGDALTHVGVVLRKGNSNSTFTSQLKVVHVSSIGDPISREQLILELHNSHRKTLTEAWETANETLTDAADANIVRALKKLRPKFSDRLEWLANIGNSRIASPSADRWSLGKDAIRAGLRIGGFSTDRLDEWRPPTDTDDVALAGIKATDYEMDLIDNDSRAFPGWTPQRSQRIGVRVFSDGERTMEITSINATRQEGNLGVDLVYYHRQSKSLLLVQYKRLEDNKRVLVDDRLRKQLARMEPLQELQRTPEHHTDWRLGHDFCFLKLCRTNTESGFMDPHNIDLLPGLYLPLSFLQLAMEDDRVRGPKDGMYLGYDYVDRHIDNTIFLQLAKEGWIGSSGVDIETIGKIANQSLAEGREFVSALDLGNETAKQRQQRTRRKGQRRQQDTTSDQLNLFE